MYLCRLNFKHKRMFFQTYQTELIDSVIALSILFVIRLIIIFSVRKIGRTSGINQARIQLINRYVTVTLLLIAMLIEAFIFGAQPKDLALIFSSVFAVIGIGLVFFVPLQGWR